MPYKQLVQYIAALNLVIKYYLLLYCQTDILLFSASLLFLFCFLCTCLQAVRKFCAEIIVHSSAPFE